MKKRNLWVRAMALALSVSMTVPLGIGPMGNMSRVWAAETEYVNNFKDANTVSNWTKAIGGGTHTIADGVLNVQTANYNESQNPYQLLFDTTSPVVKDGYVSAKINNKTTWIYVNTLDKKSRKTMPLF